MTYAASLVGYWVGQANDLVGSASGHATPGWSSGQRWSTSAAQWATAAWDPGGQVYSYGGRHGGAGAVGNQLWSTSASDQHNAFEAEWANSHDPQGYAYSYPGQAANAVYWSQSAAFWQGQAYFYWGPSRVWNSGATWEGLYNQYLPPATELSFRGSLTLPGLSSGGGTGYATINAAVNSLGASGSGSTAITLPRTGNYVIMAGGEGINDTGNTEGITIQLLISGGVGDSGNSHLSLGGDQRFGFAMYYAAALSAGTTIQVLFQTSFDAIHGSGKIVIVYQPNQTYPH